MNKANKSPQGMKIAGKKTVANWEKLKEKLELGDSEGNWKEAYGFFEERLKTRYLCPIEILRKSDERLGEGFAIVTILCSLIEFLASARTGKTYRHCKEGDCKCEKHEYHSSAKLFTDFLREQEPFCEYFKSGKKAGCFYSNVRCPLFHEARTKGGWKILAGCDSGPPFDMGGKIVYRDSFSNAIEEYLHSYREEILGCRTLQCAFIRKIDSLCVE